MPSVRPENKGVTGGVSTTIKLYRVEPACSHVSRKIIPPSSSDPGVLAMAGRLATDGSFDREDIWKPDASSERACEWPPSVTRPHDGSISSF